MRATRKLVMLVAPSQQRARPEGGVCLVDQARTYERLSTSHLVVTTTYRSRGLIGATLALCIPEIDKRTSYVASIIVQSNRLYPKVCSGVVVTLGHSMDDNDGGDDDDDDCAAQVSRTLLA
eukprot:4627706-Amphidinium_carterae.1